MPHRRAPRWSVVRRPARRCAVLVVLCAAAFGGPGRPVAAQPQPADHDPHRLEQAALIQGLASRQMTDLLDHLRAGSAARDPVLGALLAIADQRTRYRDRTLGRDERLAALGAVIAGLSELIERFPDALDRPTWQADLAELRLFDELAIRHRHADLFMEFGEPTAEQREVFAAAMTQSLRGLTQARSAIEAMPEALDGQRELVLRLQDAGLWDRWREQYGERRVPLLLATAAYGVTLLPDDAAFFEPGADGGGLTRAAARRVSLRSLAVRLVGPLIEDRRDATGLRPAALSLAGRALLALGRASEARTLLAEAVRSSDAPRRELVAQLALAEADRRLGRPDTAIERLVRLRRHAAARADTLVRLVIADATYRLLLAEAPEGSGAQAAEARELAYGVYFDLLSDPAIAEEAAGLRALLMRRWAEGAPPDAPPHTLPGAVALAVAERAWQSAQAGLGGLAPGDALPPGVRDELERAQRYAEPLLRGDRPALLRAAAMHTHAAAGYWLAGGDPAGVLASAQQLVELAEQFPGDARAPEALSTAVELLAPLAASPDPLPGVLPAYRRAAERLLETRPDSRVVLDQVLVLGRRVLEPAGQHARAEALYRRVPRDHRDYFAAQRALLGVIGAQAEAGSPDAGPRLRAEAQRVAAEAEAAIERAGDPESPGAWRARRALAEAHLAEARAALQSGDAEGALSLLQRAEDAAGGEASVTAAVLEVRLRAVRGAEDLSKLAAQGRELMAADPERGAGVLHAMLERLERELEPAARAAMPVGGAPLAGSAGAEAVGEKAAGAAEVASLLAGWAVDRGDADAAHRYAHAAGRWSLLAGDASAAVGWLEPLAEARPEDANVLVLLADALAAGGEAGDPARATRYYDRVIAGLDAPRGPLPSQWWRAWVGRLRVAERQGLPGRDLVLRVRQLARTDPALGGEPYATALRDIATRHAPAESPGSATSPVAPLRPNP